MNLIRSDVLGFCMGVRRAVEAAQAEGQRKSGHVYTLGPLIHNPEVLSSLEKQGVFALNEEQLMTSELADKNPADCTIIIRAHGIEPQVESDLRAIGTSIVDATCPNVKISQLKAEELASAGYFLFLAGEAEHAEIMGILGYVQNGYQSFTGNSSGGGPEPYCMVVGNILEAGRQAGKLYRQKTDVRTALIGQTTISQEEYYCIGNSIKNFFPNLEITQTICNATIERQNALRELLDKVEAVLIIGGKESANTRRLLTIAQESKKPCALVEKAADIPFEFRTYKTIGLSAGASTPDSVIQDIEIELMR